LLPLLVIESDRYGSAANQSSQQASEAARSISSPDPTTISVLIARLLPLALHSVPRAKHAPPRVKPISTLFALFPTYFILAKFLILEKKAKQIFLGQKR